jgi:hypothetical protein
MSFLASLRSSGASLLASLRASCATLLTPLGSSCPSFLTPFHACGLGPGLRYDEYRGGCCEAKRSRQSQKRKSLATRDKFRPENFTHVKTPGLDELSFASAYRSKVLDVDSRQQVRVVDQANEREW